MKRTLTLMALAFGLSATSTIAQNDNQLARHEGAPPPREEATRGHDDRRMDIERTAKDEKPRHAARMEQREQAGPNAGLRQGKAERPEQARQMRRERQPQVHDEAALGKPDRLAGAARPMREQVARRPQAESDNASDRGPGPRANAPMMRRGQELAMAAPIGRRAQEEFNFCPRCGQALHPQSAQPRQFAPAAGRGQGQGLGFGPPPWAGRGRQQQELQAAPRGPRFNAPAARESQNDDSPDAPRPALRPGAR